MKIKIIKKKKIDEVYDLDREQRARKDRLERQYGELYGSKMAKAAGLQKRSEQESDRYSLQMYQNALHGDRQGKKMIQAFRQGDVTILHSMGFKGATHRAGMGGTSDIKLASQWINSFGSSGKDSLSTVAFFEPPTSSIGTRKPLKNNAMFVAQARGLILKGFPVFVGEEDSFTQTLGAIDPKMKGHWVGSGIPKRPSVSTRDDGAFDGIFNLRRLKYLGYSNETILDNWSVIGTYINQKDASGQKEIDEFVLDSLNSELPCNLYDKDGKLIMRYTP